MKKSRYFKRKDKEATQGTGEYLDKELQKLRARNLEVIADIRKLNPTVKVYYNSLNE